jgi:hypothetical protein
VTPGQVDDPADAVDAIRRSITFTHGITTDAVVLATPGAIAKTSSGKVRRSDTRRLYLTDALGTVFAWRSGMSLVTTGSGASLEGGPPEPGSAR